MRAWPWVLMHNESRPDLGLGLAMAAGLSTRLVAVFALTGYGFATSHYSAVTACTWLPCERGQQAGVWKCGQSLGPLAFGAGPLAWVGVCLAFLDSVSLASSGQLH